MLIDCDIHLGYERLTDLLPYLDAPTRELVASSGTNGLAMPTYPWNHPAGWIRQDVYERGSASGDFPYLSLDLVRARHLDANGVSLGIVEPDEAAAFAVIPNAQLAARLCSAYNDWLLERWLQEEPRLRGMIVVPAQWPEAAAREVQRMGGREEFAGIFLPGAARIPYGNPVYDPIWEAASDLALPAAREALEAAGVEPALAGLPATVEVAERGDVLTVINHGGTEERLRMSHPVDELATGSPVEELTLAPFGYALLRRR